MHTTEKPSTEQRLMTNAIAIDPAERKRRLWKVYALLLDLEDQEHAILPDTSSDQSQPTD